MRNLIVKIVRYSIERGRREGREREYSILFISLVEVLTLLLHHIIHVISRVSLILVSRTLRETVHQLIQY